MSAGLPIFEAPHDASALRLKDRIIQRTGLAYYQTNEQQFWSAVGRRMAATHSGSLEDYLDRVIAEGDAGAETERLIQELTIGETYFFRHRELFDAVRTTILPDILARNQGTRRLRIWSAGCSNGAELYSIAILLNLHFKSQLQGWDVALFGTDLNQQFIAQARAAAYHPWTLRGMPNELRRACFEKRGDRYHLFPQFQSHVTLEHHNLMTAEEPHCVQDSKPIDLVICRNVMIYFDRATGVRLLQRFEACLPQDGWLLLGASESFGSRTGSLRLMQLDGAHVYRKASATDHEQRTDVAYVPTSGLASALIDPVLVDLPTVPSPAQPDGTSMAARPASPAKNGTVHALLVEPAAAPTTEDRVDRLSASELAELWGLVNCGAFASAADICAEKMQRCNFDPRLHVMHGLVCEQQHDLSGAERAFRRAIYLDARCIYAHYALAMVCLHQGRTRDAQRSLQNGYVAASHYDASDRVPMMEELAINELRDLIQFHLRDEVRS